jgi:hypothetical protein
MLAATSAAISPAVVVTLSITSAIVKSTDPLSDGGCHASDGNLDLATRTLTGKMLEWS